MIIDVGDGLDCASGSRIEIDLYRETEYTCATAGIAQSSARWIVHAPKSKPTQPDMIMGKCLAQEAISKSNGELRVYLYLLG
jgi:hypothetical protein